MCENVSILLWLTLSFLRHRNSPVVHLGLTGADWVHCSWTADLIWRLLSSPPWNTRTDKKRTILCRDTKSTPNPPYMCTVHNFPVQLFPFILVPAVRYVYMCTQSYATWQKIAQIVFACSKAIPFKRAKKMLRMIGPENPLTPRLPPHLHPAILSSPYSMLIKSGRALLSLSGISGLV